MKQIGMIRKLTMAALLLILTEVTVYAQKTTTNRAAEEIGILGVIGLYAVFSIIVAFIICKINSSKAKKLVFLKNEKLAKELKEGEVLAIDLDAQEVTCQKFRMVKESISAIFRSIINKEEIDWFVAKKDLDIHEARLSGVLNDLRREIALGKEARDEGPKLPEDFPEAISCCLYGQKNQKSEIRKLI